MKKFLAALTGIALGVVLVTGCLFCKSKAEKDAFEPIPLDELSAHAKYAFLPCKQGVLAMYTLDNEYDNQHLLFVSAVDVEAAKQVEENENLTDEVVVTIFATPKRFVAIAADFKEDVVELYEEPADESKDSYTKTTWTGQPDAVLEYLVDGADGSPKVESGKKSEVTTPSRDFKCPPVQKQNL